MYAKLNYGLKRLFKRGVLQFASNAWFINYRIRNLLYKFVGIDIGKRCFIGRNVYFDELNLQGIHIGNHVTITMGCAILSHFLNTETGSFELGEVFIGDDVFIGMNSIIAKPVVIGKDTVVGAGSIVTRNLPQGVIAGGNPAKVIKPKASTKLAYDTDYIGGG